MPIRSRTSSPSAGGVGPPRDRCGASRASSLVASSARERPGNSIGVLIVLGDRVVDQTVEIWITRPAFSATPESWVMRTTVLAGMWSSSGDQHSRETSSRGCRRLVRQDQCGSVTRLSPPPPLLLPPETLGLVVDTIRQVDALERCHPPFPALHSATPHR